MQRVVPNARERLMIKKSDGICGGVVQSSACRSILLLTLADNEVMASVSNLFFAATIAAVSIASLALVQYGSQNDPALSVHHRKHLKILAAVTVGAGLGRPYQYVPGVASGWQ